MDKFLEPLKFLLTKRNFNLVKPILKFSKNNYQKLINKDLEEMLRISSEPYITAINDGVLRHMR